MTTMPVPLKPDGEETSPPVRPLAAFLTQMIACRQRLAGYRARCRAAPDEASALYRMQQDGSGRARPLAEREV